MTGWLIDGADLLTGPDPGPTRWLVENLIVDRAIVAAVGRWKTTKSYGLLDVCISIATGAPAFGRLPIPEPGPVVFVNEESGRDALWRRLDALCRGRAIDPERLRGRLLLAANARVKLDDPGWQRELLDVGAEVRPRLFAFDPLARMKAPARNESAQNELASVIEFLRTLRDEADAATLFVHHTGHKGDTMRGTSDLESVWETRLGWKRDGTAPLVTIESEHREAEAGPPVKYRIGWDHGTRTMRFDLEGAEDKAREILELAERVLAHMEANPIASANSVDDAIEGTRKTILKLVRAYKEGGSDALRTTANHLAGSGSVSGSPLGLLEPQGTTTATPVRGKHEPSDIGHDEPTQTDVDSLAALFPDDTGHNESEPPLDYYDRLITENEEALA